MTDINDIPYEPMPPNSTFTFEATVTHAAVSCKYCGAPLFLGRYCWNDPKRLDGTRAPLPFTPMQRKHHGTRLLRQLDGVVAQARAERAKE